jgi:hypothetical protein
MDNNEFLSEFVIYNKKILKKLILVGIICLYLIFLLTYNYFRLFLNYSIEGSWFFGFITALICTFILILSLDFLWFYRKRRSQSF